MNGVTRKQARILRREISKYYGNNFIPLMTSSYPLSLGDILNRRRRLQVQISGSSINKELTKPNEGFRYNRNILSSSKINLSTKLAGNAELSDHFSLEEAGLLVKFTAENQMFLKLQGVRVQFMENFSSFRNEVLARFSRGELSARVHIITGLVYADKYYLQFSGSNGGAISFSLETDIKAQDAEVNADFEFKWSNEVGFKIDGLNGGPLAYQVSSVRLKKHLIPKSIQNKLINGMNEEDAIDTIPYNEREDLIAQDAFEVIDQTDEFLIQFEDEGEDFV